MKKSELVARVSRTFNKITFKLKKHSPEIIIVVGIVGTVTSAVMACKATTKISTIMEKSKDDLESIRDYMPEGSSPDGYGYTPEDAKKDIATVYIQTGVNLMKLYAPSIILGTLSIASILTSHGILKQRNVAIAAAYATVDKGFKEYRKRAIERFGEEVDRELKYNIEKKTFEETVIDEKNGKEKTNKTTVDVVQINGYSEYAKFFDESCAAWEKDPEYNLMFLRAQQQFANDRLRANGHLFLNEVYDMLGIERTKAGQAVGWVYDDECPVGDNFVDFGIYECNKKRNRAFVNGYERSILLDFNVDGNILDMM